MDLRRKLQLCRVSLIVLVFVFFFGLLQAVVAVEILDEEVSNKINTPFSLPCPVLAISTMDLGSLHSPWLDLLVLNLDPVIFYPSMVLSSPGHQRRPFSGSTHPPHRCPVPCATSSLTKLNNNSLWAPSPTSSQQQANPGLEEDAQEHFTDKFNNILGSVKMKKPAGFLGLSNRRIARSLLAICSPSPSVCSLTGAPLRDLIVILSSMKDFCVTWLL
ncbi:unnamed protein product [Urochloa humidicola]